MCPPASTTSTPITVYTQHYDHVMGNLFFGESWLFRVRSRFHNENCGSVTSTCRSNLPYTTVLAEYLNTCSTGSSYAHMPADTPHPTAPTPSQKPFYLRPRKLCPVSLNTRALVPVTLPLQYTRTVKREHTTSVQ